MENITALLISITAMITALASLIVKIMESKANVKSAIPKKIKGQATVDSVVTNKMEDLKEYLNADRVQIYDFHNRRTLCKWQECIKDELLL